MADVNSLLERESTGAQIDYRNALLTGLNKVIAADLATADLRDLHDLLVDAKNSADIETALSFVEPSPILDMVITNARTLEARKQVLLSRLETSLASGTAPEEFNALRDLVAEARDMAEIDAALASSDHADILDDAPVTEPAEIVVDAPQATPVPVIKPAPVALNARDRKKLESLQARAIALVENNKLIEGEYKQLFSPRTLATNIRSQTSIEGIVNILSSFAFEDDDAEFKRTALGYEAAPQLFARDFALAQPDRDSARAQSLFEEATAYENEGMAEALKRIKKVSVTPQPVTIAEPQALAVEEPILTDEEILAKAKSDVIELITSHKILPRFKGDKPNLKTITNRINGRENVDDVAHVLSRLSFADPAVESQRLYLLTDLYAKADAITYARAAVNTAPVVEAPNSKELAQEAALLLESDDVADVVRAVELSREALALEQAKPEPERDAVLIYELEGNIEIFGDIEAPAVAIEPVTRDQSEEDVAATTFAPIAPSYGVPDGDGDIEDAVFTEITDEPAAPASTFPHRMERTYPESVMHANEVRPGIVALLTNNSFSIVTQRDFANTRENIIKSCDRLVVALDAYYDHLDAIRFDDPDAEFQRQLYCYETARSNIVAALYAEYIGEELMLRGDARHAARFFQDALKAAEADIKTQREANAVTPSHANGFSDGIDRTNLFRLHSKVNDAFRARAHALLQNGGTLYSMSNAHVEIADKTETIERLKYREAYGIAHDTLPWLVFDNNEAEFERLSIQYDGMRQESRYEADVIALADRYLKGLGTPADPARAHALYEEVREIAKNRHNSPEYGDLCVAAIDAHASNPDKSIYEILKESTLGDDTAKSLQLRMEIAPSIAEKLSTAQAFYTHHQKNNDTKKADEYAGFIKTLGGEVPASVPVVALDGGGDEPAILALPPLFAPAADSALSALDANEKRLDAILAAPITATGLEEITKLGISRQTLLAAANMLTAAREVPYAGHESQYNLIGQHPIHSDLQEIASAFCRFGEAFIDIGTHEVYPKGQAFYAMAVTAQPNNIWARDSLIDSIVAIPGDDADADVARRLIKSTPLYPGDGPEVHKLIQLKGLVLDFTALRDVSYARGFTFFPHTPAETIKVIHDSQSVADLVQCVDKMKFEDDAATFAKGTFLHTHADKPGRYAEALADLYAKGKGTEENLARAEELYNDALNHAALVDAPDYITISLKEKINDTRVRAGLPKHLLWLLPRPEGTAADDSIDEPIGTIDLAHADKATLSREFERVCKAFETPGAALDIDVEYALDLAAKFENGTAEQEAMVRKLYHDINETMEHG